MKRKAFIPFCSPRNNGMRMLCLELGPLYLLTKYEDQRPLCLLTKCEEQKNRACDLDDTTEMLRYH